MKIFLKTLRKSSQGKIGLFIILLIAFLGIAAPLIAPYGSTQTVAADARVGPCLQHLLGTDESGMDIFSRCIYAIRIDVYIGVVSTLLALAIGITLGLVAGYYEGLLGEVIMRLADLLQAFPVFILAMAMVMVLGNKIQNIIFVIAFITSPVYMRFVRGEVLTMKSRPFIEAAHTAGMSNSTIMFGELLPNSIRGAVAYASINIGSSILITSGLSFLGCGVRVPTAEWGSMISLGAPLVLTGQWWAAFFPGVFIGVTVLGFAMFGDFMRTYLNPERR